MSWSAWAPGRRARSRAAAITVGGVGDLTWQQWDDGSEALSRTLRPVLPPGARAALCFPLRQWIDFAIAYAAVKRLGGTAALLSPGAAPADRERALAASGATLLLTCDGVEAVGRPLGSPGDGHDVIYPPTPLAPPRAVVRAPDLELMPVGGCLVHAWAPGTIGAAVVLQALLADEGASTVVPAAFDPDLLCALAERHRAVALGLTAPQAAAVLASGSPGRHDLVAVTQVILSGPARPATTAGLAGAFPGAEISVLPQPAGTEAVEASTPLAVSQGPMVWHEQLAPGSFNLPCLVRRYRGRLDVDALRAALAALARRHEPLRTGFGLSAGVPRQRLHDPARGELAVVDLSRLDAGARDAEVARVVAEASSRPFDLVDEPLFQPQLLVLGPDDHALVIRLHHTAFDDWSVGVFRRDLSALYGGRETLAPIRTTFAEACQREQARLVGPAGDDLRSWWRKELDGAPFVTQLPIGGEGLGPAEPIRVEVPDALASAVRALARRLRATPYMTTLAAFSAFAARLVGRDDLLLATVTAHRDASDLEPLIGCFTKKVPLRVRVDGEPTFEELVARTRSSLLGALAHHDLAFDAALQEGLGADAAEHGVAPHVAVVFQAEVVPAGRLVLPGLEIGPLDTARPQPEQHFSAAPSGDDRLWGGGVYAGTFLILSLLDTGERMSLIARGVFDTDACRRLLAGFEATLGALVSSPSAGIGPVAPLHDDDGIGVRGVRVSRSRLEAALATCSGVGTVGVSVNADRLVADVIPSEGAAPTLSDLRAALWAAEPGMVWPATAGGVEPGEPPALARTLAAMWSEVRGAAVAPDAVYWQDFSFLPLLAEAREAGLDIPDALVARNRTLVTLAAALGAAERA